VPAPAAARAEQGRVPPPPPPAALGRRALANLLRMGHCAPSVLRTLQEAGGEEAPDLIRLVAALPGMANTGNECGGLTGALVRIGLRHARDPAIGGVPAPVALGRALADAFRADHGTLRCRDILGHARLPLRCLGVVRRAPRRCLEVESGARPAAVAAERQAAHAAFCSHLAEQGFHCAQAVLHATRDPAAVRPEVLDAASAFLGGTALGGMTCGALLGGFLLLGQRLGAIEDSHLRVLRQVATMAVRGDAFADERNAFNRAMNRGHVLAEGFAAAFGSTQCRDLTGCDLATLAGVGRYVAGGCVARCQEMAREAARQAEALASRAG